MVTLIAEGGSVPAPDRGAAAAFNFSLSLVAAALQIFTTVTVVQALPPSTVGVYFKGVVVAYGLAALLRGKYELFAARHFIGGPDCSFPARDLVRGLGIRVLIRSAIACAILLVITTDLDVMEPRFRPFLQTYLPFVLAVPFATLALFLASVLRAVKRYIGSTLVATYSINVMVLSVAATVTGPEEDVLWLLSWAFFVGTVLACGVGVLITRKVFPGPQPPTQVSVDSTAWRGIYAEAAQNGLTGLTFACLQWGPVCVLAILGSESQVAHFAAVIRTAQVIDFLIPAVILVPHAFMLHSRLAERMRSEQGKLAADLTVSLATATASVLAVAAATPWIIERFGPAYAGLAELFVLLFAAQWLSGVCRPAIRHLAAHWHSSLVRRILFVSLAAAMLASLAAIPAYGALGAALSVFIGTLLLNGQALQAAIAGCRKAA